jgi:GNAT superfamily N-acetyltransferase
MMSAVGWLLRSEQASCLQLCEKETLEYGIAYYNERFRDHPEANQFREVLIDDAAKIGDAFAEAEGWFGSRGLRCHRWAPAGGVACEDLTGFLLGKGFRQHSFSAMALTQWADLQPSADVRVLPARAMRAAFVETLACSDRPNAPLNLTHFRDACLERLDDAPFEMMIAMVDKKPAGRCALFQTGDIARVMDLAVLPAFQHRGVEAALLANVLALARRMAMRNICTMAPADDVERLQLFEQIGFARAGELVEFDRIAE